MFFTIFKFLRVFYTMMYFIFNKLSVLKTHMWLGLLC